MSVSNTTSSVSQNNSVALPPTPFNNLPPELNFKIFTPLNLDHLNSLLLTSKSLKQLVSNHHTLWNGLFKKHFPVSHEGERPNPFEAFRDRRVLRNAMRSNT